jgi:hypothetical protein
LISFVGNKIWFGNFRSSRKVRKDSCEERKRKIVVKVSGCFVPDEKSGQAVVAMMVGYFEL